MELDPLIEEVNVTFNLRVHIQGKERLVAICDNKIRGKSIKHNGVTLKIREQFYGTEIFTPEEVLYELTNSTSINAFGKEICNLLIENKLVHPATVIWMEHENEKVGHVIIIK